MTQKVGRCLRQFPGKAQGTLVIPALVNFPRLNERRMLEPEVMKMLVNLVFKYRLAVKVHGKDISRVRQRERQRKDPGGGLQEQRDREDEECEEPPTNELEGGGFVDFQLETVDEDEEVALDFIRYIFFGILISSLDFIGENEILKILREF